MANIKTINTFLAMLRGRQIILIINSDKMKVLGANDSQRFDFTMLIAELVGQDHIYQSSVKTDCAVGTIDDAFKQLINDGYCNLTFKDEYDRYKYVDSNVSRFYM